MTVSKEQTRPEGVRIPSTNWLASVAAALLGLFAGLNVFRALDA